MAARHGGDQGSANVDDLEIAATVPEDELLSVSEALEKFAARDKQKAELAKLRYFVGLSLEETAEVLGVASPLPAIGGLAAGRGCFRRLNVNATARANDPGPLLHVPACADQFPDNLQPKISHYQVSDPSKPVP